MRIIVTRHGETEENRDRVLMGHLPGVLSDLGKEQALRLAKRLKNEKIDLIVSSDLDRAFDTAKTVGEFHDAPLKSSEKLRERNLGVLQGKRFEPKGETGRFPEEDFDKYGESKNDMIIRSAKIINEIRGASKNDVLIVAHNGINKALIGILSGMEFEDIWNMENQGNTAITIFEEENGEMKLRLLNCVDHLE